MFHRLLRVCFFWAAINGSFVSVLLYADGFDEYARGKFEVAETLFKEKLAQHPTAELYKMKGLCEFMQGKRSEAGKSFQKAKSLQPSIQLSSRDILDQSVVDFFSSITVPKGALPITKKPKRVAASPPVVVPAAAPAPMPAPVLAPVPAPVQDKPTSVVGAIALPETSTSRHEGHHADPLAALHALESLGHEGKEHHAGPHAHSPWLYWLPFGVGQYLNHDYGWGGFSTGVQVASLGTAVYYYQNGGSITDNSNAQVAARTKYSDDINNFKGNRTQQLAYYQTNIVDYQNAQKADADAAYQTSYILFGVFASMWVTSSLESFLTAPDPEPSSHSHASFYIRPEFHSLSLHNPTWVASWDMRF